MDTYLPLAEAARKVRIPEPDLNQLAQVGKIKAIMMHGKILLRESDVMAQQPRENFSHLEGQPISMGDASRKYNLPKYNLSRWKDKNLIRVVKQEGQKIYLNEADVAFMASTYKPGQGTRTDRTIRK